MVKRFNIAVPKQEGGVDLYPMKKWLRRNPQNIPSGLDATFSTSHQLRSGLQKMGWLVKESFTEVRLMPPGNFAG